MMMTHSALVLASLFSLPAVVVLAACHHGASGPPHGAPDGVRSLRVLTPAPVARSGTLVFYMNGTELGRERYEDNGHTLHSTITAGRRSFELTVQRAPSIVHVAQGGHSVTREVGPDTLVLENGGWQSIALAVEGLAAGGGPHDMTVLLPAQNTRVPGRLAVQASTQQPAHRSVALTVGGVDISVDIDPDGRVARVLIPAQGVEVVPEGVEPVRRAPRVLPSHVTEEAVEVMRAGVAIRGVLWRPASATEATPVVLFIAGSGPTDRDCNQAPVLLTDSYWLMASALASQGIASLRFDKRGVGQSGQDFSPADVTLDDFVRDAVALIEHLRRDPRTASITLAGHSEGGLIALLAAQLAPVEALALLASPGRPMGVLVREQLARQLDAAQLTEVDRALAAVRAGQPIGDVPGPLRRLFNPTIARYLRSIVDVDPAAVLHGLRIPTVIIQGETDAQVSVVDARMLAAAQPGARLVVLAHTNHVFKEEASSALPQASYGNPALPLAPGVVDALVSAVPRAIAASSAPPAPRARPRGHGRRP